MNPMWAGVLAVLLSLGFWLLILVVQWFETRVGYIPQRSRGQRPFRYFQDWYTTTLGDWIGLSLIDFVCGYYVSAAGGISLYLVLVALVAGFCMAWLAHRQFGSPRHVPDSGYPRPGRASVSGALHILYFFAQGSACVLALLLAVLGQLGAPLLAMALGGGGIYLASYALDYRQGIFFKKLPFMK